MCLFPAVGTRSVMHDSFYGSPSRHPKIGVRHVNLGAGLHHKGALKGLEKARQHKMTILTAADAHLLRGLTIASATYRSSTTKGRWRAHASLYPFSPTGAAPRRGPPQPTFQLKDGNPRAGGHFDPRCGEVAVICVENDFSVTNPPAPGALRSGARREDKRGGVGGGGGGTSARAGEKRDGDIYLFIRLSAKSGARHVSLGAM